MILHMNCVIYMYMYTHLKNHIYRIKYWLHSQDVYLFVHTVIKNGNKQDKLQACTLTN